MPKVLSFWSHCKRLWLPSPSLHGFRSPSTSLCQRQQDNQTWNMWLIRRRYVELICSVSEFLITLDLYQTRKIWKSELILYQKVFSLLEKRTWRNMQEQNSEGNRRWKENLLLWGQLWGNTVWIQTFFFRLAISSLCGKKQYITIIFFW